MLCPLVCILFRASEGNLVLTGGPMMKSTWLPSESTSTIGGRGEGDQDSLELELPADVKLKVKDV